MMDNERELAEKIRENLQKIEGEALRGRSP